MIEEKRKKTETRGEYARKHRDTALRHRRASRHRNRKTRMYQYILINTNNKQQSTMGRGVGYNRTGRRTDVDTCSSMHRKEVGWRCCRKHTGIPQSSASLPKPAQKGATELWKREKRSVCNPTTLRPLYARSPFSLLLPPFYILKKGAVSLLNCPPNKSNYLGSSLYLIPSYLHRRSRTREGPVRTRLCTGCAWGRFSSRHPPPPNRASTGMRQN